MMKCRSEHLDHTFAQHLLEAAKQVALFQLREKLHQSLSYGVLGGDTCDLSQPIIPGTNGEIRIGGKNPNSAL